MAQPPPPHGGPGLQPSQQYQHPPGQGQYQPPQQELPGDQTLPQEACNDPANMLRVFPFATYTPTARVAGYFAPNTITYQPSVASDTLYPRQQGEFQRIDQPQNAADLAMHDDAQRRLASVLQQAQSYGLTQSYAPPKPVQRSQPVQQHYQQQQHQAQQQFQQPYQQQFAQQMPHQQQFLAGSPQNYRIPHSQQYQGQNFQQPQDQQLQQFQQQFGQQSPQRQHSALPSTTPPSVQPMATSLLGSSAASSSGTGQPPTPNSAAAPPSASSSLDYFENYINRTLNLQSPSPAAGASRASSVSSTPIAGRHEKSSAGKGGMPGPSPSKKVKTSNDVSRTSESPTPVTPNRRVMEIDPPKLTHAAKAAYTSMSSASDLQRSTMSMHSTPRAKEESDDDIDWGDRGQEADVDMTSPARYGETLVAPTSGRTGDKDQRSSFEKLQNLLEDIFEESDAFDANPTADDMASARFFGSLSKEGAPLLSVSAMDKIVRYVARLQANIKRQRKVGGQQAAWDVDSLSRLFKLLERTMRDGAELNPFPNTGARTSVAMNESPVKKGSPVKGALGDAVEVSDEEIARSENILSTMLGAVSAAQCCLVVLNGKLPKQLYSEDLLTLAVSTVREQMSKVLFPVVEGLAGEKIHSQYLANIAIEEAAAAKSKSRKLASMFKHPTISAIAQTTCAAVPHIAALISRPDMSFSDSLVIQTVYLAVGPVFVNDPAVRRTKGKPAGASWSVMKSLRTEALGCLRGAFAKYADQRQWIIEEILGSLGKTHTPGAGQTLFQLPNGQSINTLSALLLQLVQACSHGVGKRIRKLHTAEQGFEAEDQATGEEETQILGDAMENAARSAQIVVVFLVQKSSLSKANKTSNDANFKGILDTLVTDLLTVLFHPEWPAASLFLGILSKSLMAALNEQSSAAHSVALDYLGDIAAHLRYLQLDVSSIMPSLDQIISSADRNDLATLLAANSTIQHFLLSAARQDSMFISSGEMGQIMWARELHSALAKANSVIQRLTTELAAPAEEGKEAETNEAEELKENLQGVSQSLLKATRAVWRADDALFEITDPNQAEDALKASLAVSTSHSLHGAFNPILHALIAAMDSGAVAQRSKALRGLSSIVVKDPGVLSMDVVHAAIEDRLTDSSPAVRDAAVDLIGKYVVQQSHLAVEYYPLIALRVTDTGLGVRKRVIKLLREIFNSTDNEDVQVKICCNLIVACEDEDDNVKELAVKSLGEILYPTPFAPDKTATLLVSILKEYQGKPRSIESALEGVATKVESDQHFPSTINSLIKQMVDATEDPDFDAASHIHAIYLLSINNPALIDTNKASILATNLKTPTNHEERITNDLLLKIFTSSIPYMPKASSTFAQDLSKTVRAMIGRPTGGLSALQQPVACYCAVVNNLTKEYLALLSLLRSCIEKMKTIDKNANPFPMFNYITALISEHCDLDTIASQDDVLQAHLSKITDDEPLRRYLFDRYLDFAQAVASQQHPILCLGCLFRAHPKLILDKRAEKWMGKIFQGNSEKDKAQLLNMLHGFLESQAKKKIEKTPTEKGINELIGSGADLHDSGVSTALVQHNIDYIIEGAQSHHPALQAAAMSVFAFTINQGLYHPLRLLPVLISLETSSHAATASQALELHTTLHTKHPSLLNVRHLEFAQASFEYQKGLTSEVTGHHNGKAHFAGWYSLLSEKRAWKLEFLKALTKAFEFELLGTTAIDPQFVLYLAENLVLLDYQTQEEVMIIVQHLSHVISDGTAVSNAFEQGQIEGTGVLQGNKVIVSDTVHFSASHLANASIIVCLAILTKNLLLDNYGLTEDKCLKLVAGKKSAIGDKTTTKKHVHPVPLEAVGAGVYARGVETVEEYEAQRAAFLHLMREDSTLGAVM